MKMNSKDKLTEATMKVLNKSNTKKAQMRKLEGVQDERLQSSIKWLKDSARSNGPSVYIAILELNYDLIAVGNSRDECKDNLIKAFTKWAEEHPDAGSVENWVSNIAGEDFSDYDFDVFRFISEYYGLSMGRVDGFGVREWLED